jgi:hypothetical protein
MDLLDIKVMAEMTQTALAHVEGLKAAYYAIEGSDDESVAPTIPVTAIAAVAAARKRLEEGPVEFRPTGEFRGEMTGGQWMSWFEYLATVTASDTATATATAT